MSEKSSFYCKLCKLTSPSRSVWVGHLSSPGHRVMVKNTKFGGMKDWCGDRTLRVAGCEKVMPSAIVSYLDSFGVVDGFYYQGMTDGGPSECFAVMKDVAPVRNILKTRFHKMGKEVKIERTSLVRTSTEKCRLKRRGSSSPHDDDNTSGVIIKRGGGSSSSSSPGVRNVCSCCQVVVWNTGEWITHLSSTSHQVLFRKGDGVKVWDWRKALMVKTFWKEGEGEALDLVEILGWGMDFGKVIDACNRNSSGEVKGYSFNILFEEEDAVHLIMRKKDFYSISGKRVIIEPLPPFSGHSKTEKMKHRKLQEEERLKEVKREAELDEKELEEGMINLYNALEGNSLEDQFRIFLEESMWSGEMYEEMEGIVEKIRSKVITELPPPLRIAKLEPNGPFLTKLGLKGRNRRSLYMILNLKGVIEVVKDYKVQFALVDTFINGIEKCVDDLTPRSLKSEVSPKTNLPVISFSRRGIDYVIQAHTTPSFALVESRLIQHYSKMDPRFLPLLQIIMKWSTQLPQLSPTEEIFPGQMVSMMVLTFLRTKEILPSVYDLQKAHAGVGKVVDRLDVSFLDGKVNTKVMPELEDPFLRNVSILGLLRSFFYFYGFDVNIPYTVICPYVGKIIPKSDFLPEHHGNLPQEIREIVKAEKVQMFMNNTIVVQDPFLFNRNIAKCTKSKRLKLKHEDLTDCFHSSFWALDETVKDSDPSLAVLFKPKNKETPINKEASST